VLDEARQLVFAQDGISTRAAAERIILGGDVTGILTGAAIAALPSIPGHDAESVALLARFVHIPETRQAAIAAIRRIPQTSWRGDHLASLADAIVAYVRGVPASERTGAAFKEAVEFGRELATQMPAAHSHQIRAAIDQAVVRTIRIEAVLGAMRFDIGKFLVDSGEEIEIEFVNPDVMPHNLLITAPGALESVSLKAEAMIKEADAFSKSFIPDSTDVLFATKLINSGETARLRFAAPARPGTYPFVCTFPGHWRTMNGVMQVLKK
jgi:azurin